MSQMKAGALLSYFSLFITLLISLLYTPIVIRLLGQSEYGLYALIGSIASYFSIMDMGLGNAIVRYNARNRVEGNKQKEAHLNGLFMLMYSIIGVVTILIGMIFLNKLEVFFGNSLTDSELIKAKIMVIILIINFSLSFPLTVFSSIIKAYEKFVISKLVAIIRTILSPIITLPLLFLGYGSVTMVVVTTIVNISCLLFNLFYCIRYIKIRLKFGKVDLTFLREIIGYSSLVFLGVIVDQIYWNTDQFILGAVTGTVPVAIYAIAMQFIILYKQFSTSISGLFLPRVSMLVAKNASSDKLTEIMIKYGRLQFIILAFILSGFTLYGYSFINVWAGSDYTEAYYIVILIMIPLCVPLIQNIGISILYAKNLQAFRSIVLILIATFNVVISIPLAQKYSGVGVAIATALSLVLGNIIAMNIYYQKKIGLDIPLFWRNIIKLTIPVIFSLLIGRVIGYLSPNDSIIFLILEIIIYCFLFVLCLWTLGMNDYEKKLTISIINNLRQIPKKGEYRK
ncbi:oligosaccharide flippase family protein [Gracilibacillus lacisalsi]|uniref:oligosaccharide flippase family protein n=1 Tax=Gracilibacillus lacisalsi TaxID=393087 RepID=UPI00035E653B|nr:oligosaccharide flippase family protein [Gracilibacillus lacisalsi]